jgi:hypothetical protein
MRYDPPSEKQRFNTCRKLVTVIKAHKIVTSHKVAERISIDEKYKTYL